MSTSIIHGDAQGRGAGVGESLFLITLHWPLWCKTLFKRNVNISCRLDHVVLQVVWFHIPNVVLIAVAFLGRFPLQKRICVSMGFLNVKKMNWVALIVSHLVIRHGLSILILILKE